MYFDGLRSTAGLSGKKSKDMNHLPIEFPFGDPAHPYLIASDLDGTLILHPNGEFGDNDTLPPDFFPVLDLMLEKGILFCAATGRSFAALPEHFGDYAYKICCTAENGAYLYSEGKLLEIFDIPRPLAKEIVLSIMPREDCAIRVNTPEQRYYLVKREEDAALLRTWEYADAITAYTFDEIPGKITQITAVSFGEIGPVADVLIPMWKDRVGVIVAGKHWLDFTCAGKGKGLLALCRHLGVPRENTIALGDNFNDEEMLEAAAAGILMDTAHPDLLERFPLHTGDAVSTILELAENL